MNSAFAWNGSTFEAREAASGPWSAHHCHGGAPAALMVHVANAVPTREPMSISRVTCDFLGPVPIAEPLRTTSRVVKDGRKMQLTAIEFEVAGRLVLRGSVLKTAGFDTPAGNPEFISGGTPPPSELPPAMIPGGFASQFTIIPILGGFSQPGPGEAWFRFDTEIVAGFRPGPMERAVASADFANGVGMGLSFDEWLFPTLDLTVGLARAPIDEWIRVDARTELSGAGRALCQARLSDRAGVFGHCIQTVLIERRD